MPQPFNTIYVWLEDYKIPTWDEQSSYVLQELHLI